MITIKNYVRAESLEEAYELNQKKMNTILGGMLWMKMSSRNIQTAVDLSGLGLDQIEEDEETFRIGAMCSLREIETDIRLNRHFGGAIRESLRYIVGVQFRNCATIGGSIYGRFGFSDILTCLLVLDCCVELYKGGIISLREFIDMPKNSDILVRIILGKDNRKASYQSFRRTKTDLPILTAAVSRVDDVFYVAVGARPMKAAVIEMSEVQVQEERDEQKWKVLSAELAGRFSYGSNMRGSGEYREHLAAVAIRRAFKEIVGGASW